MDIQQNDASKIDLPSFHIFGEKDPILADGQALEPYWNTEKRMKYTHTRGHEIDMNMTRREPELGKLLKDFLDEQKNDYVDEY